MKGLIRWFKDPGRVEFCDGCARISTSRDRQRQVWESTRVQALSSAGTYLR